MAAALKTLWSIEMVVGFISLGEFQGFIPKIPPHKKITEFLSIPEQYDTFVKFTHDQLMRRFGEQPASCENSFKLECAPASVMHPNVFFCFPFLQMFPECGTEISARRPPPANCCAATRGD